MPVIPIVVSALIAGPLAFVIGWMVSKAYFRLDVDGSAPARTGKAGQPSSSATGKVRALETVVMRHEATQAATRKRVVGLKERLSQKDELVSSIDEELRILRRELAIRDETIEQLRNSGNGSGSPTSEVKSEMIVLRAERDEFLGQIEHLEKRLQNLGNDTSDAPAPIRESDESVAEVMEQLRQSLSKRNKEIFELRERLHERDDRERELNEKLKSWNDRVEPLSQQSRKQRSMIRELRTQLKNASVDGNGHTPVTPAPKKMPVDDLQQICGIGPALRKKLNNRGIKNYRQIAELSESRIAELAKQLRIGERRIQRDEWVRQAQQLHTQKYPDQA